MRLLNSFPFLLAVSMLSGCSVYSVSEQEMTDYLQENIDFNQSVGVENVLYAQVAIEDLKANIGRADADRISVFANTNAKIEVFNQPSQSLDLNVEFSAVPEYNQESGEVFLKHLRLEKFDETGGKLAPELKTLLKPAISTIGYILSSQPVYKLDTNSLAESLFKSSSPNLLIEDNKLVVDVFD